MKRLLATALASVVVLGLADLLTARGQLWVASPIASHLLTGYEAAAPDGTRRGDGASSLRLSGLWAGSGVRVRLQMGARNGPRRYRVLANGIVAADLEVADELQTVELLAHASATGEVQIQIHGGRREETVYRLRGLEVEQSGPRGVPLARLIHYLACGLWVAVLLGILPRAKAAGWISAVILAALGLGIVVARLQVLPLLPQIHLALAVGAALRLAAEAAPRLFGMPAFSAFPILVLCGLRAFAVSDLEFPSIDAQWHTHNLMWFDGRGALVESGAPGIARAPYPPAFYALVAPFRGHDYWYDVRLVRVAMALLDGCTAFLVFGVARAAGLAPRNASLAALMAACLPEGILVLGKGIAANILGQFATVLSVLAYSRPSANGAFRLAALTLLFLSHAPAAVLGGLLLVLWWLLAVREHALDRRALWACTGAFVLAAAVAWLVYYREVGLVFGDSNRPDLDARFFELHTYRLGKIAQDLLLKFGGLPLAVAALGLAGRRAIPRLRPLVEAWLTVVLLFAALAVLTPFPLRFEYFAVPLVALLCGAAVEGRPDRERWCLAAAGVAALIQLVECVSLRLGRFELIAVIMESPRWPFPFTW